MTDTSFGNNPAKIARYKAFWSRQATERPLVGFSSLHWFPVQEFAVSKAWEPGGYLTPDMIDIDSFLQDHIRLLREGEVIQDDLIRGACPAQVAIPWLSGIVGCKLRILPDNVLGEEQHLSWDEVAGVRLDRRNPWYQKYIAFTEALVRVANGTFPVSPAPEIGPTDLHAALRGHTQSILDLADEPERSADLLARLAEIFREVIVEVWKRIPRFHGGWFDAQYSLWAPGKIVRLQEDATAVYSPALYRRFVQPVDRMLAARFDNSFIHLHSTSMFLLDCFLEIEEIRCLQANNDVGGPPIREMVRYFQRIQKAGKPLLIRGAFTADELKLLLDTLDPRGLFLNIMVSGMDEVAALRPLAGMS